MDPLTQTPEKKPRFAKLHRLLHDKKGLKYYAIALAVLIVVGGGVVIWAVTSPNGSPINIFPVASKKPAPVYYSPLTGLEVKDEATTKRPVTAVMIENSPDARPQSGLKSAGVVFEAIAEGGITRFIALYQESQPSLIGPVRSVRPYYVQWVDPFDAAIAHIGGSSKALSMVRSGNYGVDLDQFFNDGAYWRATDRYAPHNVYTSMSKLNALEKTKHKTSSKFTSWPRQDEAAAAKPNAKSITLPVSTGFYAVSYKYDSKNNAYLRSEGGAKHMDREKGQIEPKVVIAIEVPLKTVFEDGYRESYGTTGSGKAYVFQNGTVTKATWSKPSSGSQILFKDSAGKQIPLNRGQTWISAIPDKPVSWQ